MTLSSEAVAHLGVGILARLRVLPLGIRSLDRRRQPGAHVAPPPPAAQRIDPQIRGDPSQPGPEIRDRRVGRLRQEPHEGFLDDVVGVLRAPGQSIGESPQPAPLGAEERLDSTARSADMVVATFSVPNTAKERLGSGKRYTRPQGSARAAASSASGSASAAPRRATQRDEGDPDVAEVAAAQHEAAQPDLVPAQRQDARRARGRRAASTGTGTSRPRARTRAG